MLLNSLELMARQVQLMPSNMSERAELIGQEFDVLDFGKVILLDVMGCDKSIVNNARTSYHPDSTITLSDDETLIRYLARNRHSTPTETGNHIKLFISCPILVERQWARHRTARWNEVSGRYSVLPEKFYIPTPDQICHQDNKNRQGRAERLDDETTALILKDQREHCEAAFHMYHEHLKMGLARETARDILPFCTYTEKVWEMDLSNLFHFLGLRMDGHAQYEIRMFANVIGEQIISRLFPVAYQAFLDYQLNAVKLSALEISIIQRLAIYGRPDQVVGEPHDKRAFMTACDQVVTRWQGLERCRERDECWDKLVMLKLCSNG